MWLGTVATAFYMRCNLYLYYGRPRGVYPQVRIHHTLHLRLRIEVMPTPWCRICWIMMSDCYSAISYMVIFGTSPIPKICCCLITSFPAAMSRILRRIVWLPTTFRAKKRTRVRSLFQRTDMDPRWLVAPLSIVQWWILNISLCLPQIGNLSDTRMVYDNRAYQRDTMPW